MTDGSSQILEAALIESDLTEDEIDLVIGRCRPGQGGRGVVAIDFVREAKTVISARSSRKGQSDG